MDKDSLKKKTVAQLREEAKKIPDAKGLSSMKKDDLIELLLKQSPQAPAAEKTKKPKKKAPAGAPRVLSKSDLKKRIRKLKEKKRDALAKGDKEQIKECNRQIHSCKHYLRRMAPKKQKKPKE